MNNKTKENAEIIEVFEKVPPDGPGRLLKAVREECDITVEEVSKKLYLASRFIYAIERDDYEETPGVSFVRGYLRAYARLLQVDPDMIIAKFESLGLKDKPASMPTHELYRKHTSILEKILPWTTILAVIAFAIFAFVWWHNHNDMETAIKFTNVLPQINNSRAANVSVSTPSAQPITTSTSPVVDKKQQVTNSTTSQDFASALDTHDADNAIPADQSMDSNPQVFTDNSIVTTPAEQNSNLGNSISLAIPQQNMAKSTPKEISPPFN